MRHSVRRAAVLVAAPALALAALAGLPDSASAVETDPNPAVAAAGWLAMQPEDGIVSYESFGSVYPDAGLSIDVGFALQLIGDQASTVTEIGTGVAGAVEDASYAADYSYEAPDDYTDPDSPVHEYSGRSANATAKALTFLKSTGGHDELAGSLTSKLVDDIVDGGPGEGRLTDWPMKDGSDYPAGDYANILGQAFAVRALDATNHPAATPATSYLLGLQCADGSFKEALPAASVAPTCAAAAGDPSIDATATAILALATRTGTTGVPAALTQAATWLEDQQLANGAFSTGTDFGANANSTGLATTALAVAADGAVTPAITKGAVWVRQHQVHYQDACAPYAVKDSGAIAYEDADRTAAQKGGIKPASYGTWLRATAQAAPALLWAPQGDGANVLFTAEYVKAGGTKPVGVTGAAPGEQLCAVAGGSQVVGWANANGEASLKVAIPAKTATTKVSVYDVESKVGTATIRALGAKRLKVQSPRKAKLHQSTRVLVSGLAPGESVTIRVRGSRTTGQANRKGIFATVMRVPGKAGRAKIAVTGQFVNRTGSKTFRVVR